MPRRTPLIVLAAALAGCGGSAAAEDAAKPRAENRPAAVTQKRRETRAELVAAAKRICARMEQRTAGHVPTQGAPTPEQLRAIIDAWAVTVDELRARRAPPAEARRFARMLAHFDDAIRAARALPDATDETALVVVAAMADAGMKGGAIAHGYGLDECSLFPPAPSRAQFERFILEQARKQEGMFPLRPSKPRQRVADLVPKPKKRP